MAEKPQSADKRVGRRKFLKATGGAVVGVATLGLGVAKEARPLEQGIPTSVARFYTLYDTSYTRRPYSSEYSSYPPLDAVWIEILLNPQQPEAIFNLSAQEILDGLIGTHLACDVTPQKQSTKDYYSWLVNNRTKIALGELELVLTREEMESQKLSFLKGVFSDEIMFKTIETVLGGGILNAVFNLAKEELGRRKFLKMLGAATGGLLLSPFVGSASEVIGSSIEGNKRELHALKRILLRFNGVQSHFHPEIVKGLVRHLFDASKIITLAEEEGQTVDKLPNIGFNFGMGHSGIEDFLALGSSGKKLCHRLIGLLPGWYLRQLAEANGGPEGLASMRVIGFSKKQSDFQIDDLQPGEIKAEDYGVITDRGILKIAQKAISRE